MKKEKALSISAVKTLLENARENCGKIADKNCYTYISWNAGNIEVEKKRRHELAIERAGIDNLYYEMCAILNRIEDNNK